MTTKTIDSESYLANAESADIANSVAMIHLLSQFKTYRKWKGGKWYHIRTLLNMPDFWTQKKIKSCGARVIDSELYPKN